MTRATGYLAERVCRQCGVEWTIFVDRPARAERRESTCAACRGLATSEARSHMLPRLLQPAAGQEWHDDALCREVDADLFFPEKGGSTREAKSVCAGCPVVALCLAWAMETHEPHGIWGGLAPKERWKLRTRGAAS